MSAVNDVLDRTERPPYVRFERIAVEDKAASLREGRYVAKDIDMALVTPPYSKDIFKQKAGDWLKEMRRQVQMQRMPQEWSTHFEKQYEAFQNGQTVPLVGTAIRGWGVISPAQQENLIRMNILTVEDLAVINDEGLRRIGMGSIDLKNKAKAWLVQLQDKGPLTIEMASLKTHNENLKNSLASMQLQLERLLAQQHFQDAAIEMKPMEIQPLITAIAAADILPATGTAMTIQEQYAKKFGKPPHHRMKPETIEEALRG